MKDKNPQLSLLFSSILSSKKLWNTNFPNFLPIPFLSFLYLISGTRQMCCAFISSTRGFHLLSFVLLTASLCIEPLKPHNSQASCFQISLLTDNQSITTPQLAVQAQYPSNVLHLDRNNDCSLQLQSQAFVNDPSPNQMLFSDFQGGEKDQRAKSADRELICTRPSPLAIVVCDPETDTSVTVPRAHIQQKKGSPAPIFTNPKIKTVSPIEYGHVLLIPRILECLPQRIDHESLLLALYMPSEAGNPYFRMGYNSLGAFATINHLHFQWALYLEH